MSLARAFTTRAKIPSRPEDVSAATMGRASSQRVVSAKPINRGAISGPVALLSTTNMLSYEAPDIHGKPRIITNVRSASNSSSSTSSGHSSDNDGDRSDASSTGGHSHHTDATSVAADDASPLSPGLSYLGSVIKPAYTPVSPRNQTDSVFSSYQPMADTPQPPQRAPSHNIKAHVLSHKRSMQRMAIPPSPRHISALTRDSSEMFDSKHASEVDSPATIYGVTHPFGKELEQLNEAAEEFGHAVRNAEADADRTVMKNKGLARFCADDYMAELAGFYATTFAQDFAILQHQPMTWI